MKSILIPPCLMCFISCISLNASAKGNPWENITTPWGSTSRIIGSNNAGCIEGALSLEDWATGFQVVHPNRSNSHYSHPQTLQFIRDLGKSLALQGIPILIGDLSLPRGGPFVSRHASHTNGTDFDVWFLLDSRLKERPLTQAERASLEPYSLANLDANTLIEERWNSAYKSLLQTTALDPRTHTVFVHPAIKRKLCADTKNHMPWLAKIRPWWGHDEHMHVRLTCPPNSPDCVEKPRPTDIACDSTLDWWFSEEWRKEYEDKKKNQQSSDDISLPNLPSACNNLLLAQ